eukprot:4330338-Amphidinium_carterae.5
MTIAHGVPKVSFACKPAQRQDPVTATAGTRPDSPWAKNGCPAESREKRIARRHLFQIAMALYYHSLSTKTKNCTRFSQ